MPQKRNGIRSGKCFFTSRWALFVRILPALQGNFLSTRSAHQKKILHGLACVFKGIIAARWDDVEQNDI